MKRSDLFEPIEPPPFGWTSMRERLRARAGSRTRLAAAIATLAAVAAAAAVVLVWPGPRVDLLPAVDASTTAGLMGRDRAGGEPVTLLSEGALQRLPSTNPSVVLYRVELLQ